MNLGTITGSRRNLVRAPGGRTTRLRGPAAPVAAVLALALGLTGCGSSTASDDPGEGGGKDADRSEAVVSVTPKDGADGISPSGGLKVAADRGRLTEVTVEDADGRAVQGSLAEDGGSWRPDSHLSTGTRYRVHAVAEDGQGRETTERTRFTTLDPAPENTVIGRYTPDDGATVGVGMPVSFEFTRPVGNRAEAEEAISVSADPEVAVEGHWFGNQRLDFRPEKYWKAGTEVTMKLNLDGVETSDGTYGIQTGTVRFTVGRRQVSVVDAKKKTMTVTRDGKTVKTVPITSGSSKYPTYNGRMVISERHRETRMDGRTVGFGRDEDKGGYDIKDVPHAMRLSTSGTFIHGNYWNPRETFGKANVSHGCVGLFDKKGGADKGTPGSWFYRHSIVGDVVEIKNSKDETIAPDNGLNGWNMDWSKWTAPQA